MSILANAVSSIQLGVDDFRLAQQGDEARALSAIRNLTAGLLLLFKVKLQELSPEGSNEALLKARLVLQKSADGSPGWVGKGNATVDVDEMINRLDGLGIKGIDWSLLRQLQKIRNDVEHYYTKEPVSQVLQAISASFYLLRQFVPTHLKESPVDLLGADVWYFIVEQQEFYDAEVKACWDALEGVEWPLRAIRDSLLFMHCPECQSQLVRPLDPSIAPPNTSFVCTKCHEQTEWTEFVEPALTQLFEGRDYVRLSQGGEPGLADCYECGEHTFVQDEARCAACLAVARVGDCWRCGNELTREEIEMHGSLCDYCNYQREKVMRDD
ncbi:hypothetical protein [Pseudomonas sp. MOIL14HWK12:I2]|uniref:hypothetical protein n=1 Tax=Pseudomonas sp. MOIL14HWK12:I2 TaxID=1033994 RepID=UPI0015A69D29|nr:hypothetical protein [Pseudomonas sp. MOIL14HWK12:I2]